MKTEEMQSLFEEYEHAACEVNQVECWSARDLQKLLGYSLWQNFTKVIDTAKDFAAEMTRVNVLAKNLQEETAISKEHIDNNAAVRQMLVQRGIVPENLLAVEDVKKVERRLG